MININCDVGEGIGNEQELFKYIGSCSIACGGHAGDEESMSAVLQMAKVAGVKVGAHPSYPDKANFGRKTLEISKKDLISSIQCQVDVLIKIANELGMQLEHIKAHGALYNDALKNQDIAIAYLDAVEQYQLPIYVPCKTVVSKLAHGRQVEVVFEAFADRNYNQDMSLISRSAENAIINDPYGIAKHINLIRDGVIKTPDGQFNSIRADTFCVHSDTDNALEIVQLLYKEFKIEYKPFGDKGVLMEWPQEMSSENLDEILKMCAALKHNGIEHVQGVASILVLKDLTRVELKNIDFRYQEKSPTKRYRHFIPVCYDESFGLDLAYLAEQLGLSIEEIINIHSQPNYQVFALGFLPGFLYMGGLDSSLHFDRKGSPRPSISKGAVGIGGKQTGIYPQESPGGWQIIGKTPIELFQVQSEPPCFTKAGDEIKFEQISLETFQQIEAQVSNGTYELRKEVIE